MRPQNARFSRAFTLVELLLVIAIIALLVSIALPVLASARKSARTTLCVSNMRQLALASQNYAGDSKGRAAGFSWTMGERNSEWSDLNVATRPQDAHSDQAVHILRTLLRKGPDEIPVSWERIKDRNLWHLVLTAGGHFGAMHPKQRAVICPDDALALLWQDTEPSGIDALVGAGLAPSDMVTGAARYMLPFWSTYFSVPASFTPDGPAPGLSTFVQDPDHHRWLTYAGTDVVRTLRLQVRRFDEVTFPSQKVYMFDYIDRHSARRPLWYAYAQSRVPLALFDGSVRIARTADAKPGGRPDQPWLTNPTTYRYDPRYAPGWEGFDPPSLTGDRFEQMTGYYVWTLRGIRGTDF